MPHGASLLRGLVAVTAERFLLRAQVSTDNPGAIRPLLERMFVHGTVTAGEGAGEFRVEAEMEGPNARDLNRSLLSELRRAEKRTRLRSEWTRAGVTERFFDYVPKGQRKG